MGVPNQSYLYICTTKEIAAFAARTLKESHRIKGVIETLTNLVYTIPVKFDTCNPDYRKLTMSKEIDDHYKRKTMYCQNKGRFEGIWQKQH